MSEVKAGINLLLGAIFEAKKTGKGRIGRGKIYVELMQIITDNSDDISSCFGGSIDRFLLRLLRGETDYPYTLFSFERLEKSTGDYQKFLNYLAKAKKFCSLVLDENKIEQLVYTLLEIIRQDSSISTILYGPDYISKEKLLGSYAHPKRICVEALLLGLLYHVHKNPADSESIELLDIPEKLTFHAVRYRDKSSLDTEMPIDLAENIREIAKRQKQAEMKYQLEMKYNYINIDRLPENKNIFLYGTGGSGKTTLLLNQLGNENTVSFYFTLYQHKSEIHENFQSESCWILLQILLKYHYQYEYHTYENLTANEGETPVLQQLTELDKLLKSTPINGQQSYTLLLDGLNEMSSDLQRDFMKELEWICQNWKNVRIIITGRTVPNYELFSGFKCIEVVGVTDIDLDNALSKNSIILPNEKLREILKNPLFLNMYIEGTTKGKSLNTRGEILDSYIVNRKGSVAERFILQFVLPIVGKRMLNCYSKYEITRGEIISAADYALKIYVHNDFVYQNYIATKSINKKDLLKSRQNTDWVELIIYNTGLMEASISEPHKLHFVHQLFRDYFGAKHILNAVEAIDMGYGSGYSKEKEAYAHEVDFSYIWFNEEENNDNNDAYTLVGEISGDYRNQARENLIYCNTPIDTLLNICRQFNIPRAAENIFRTLRISRNKVICGVDFSGVNLPVSFPTYAKFSMNGNYPCDFSGSRMCFNALLELSYTYAYSADRSIILFLVGCGDVAVWSFQENKLVGDYNFFEYEKDEYNFNYAEISEDNRFATLISICSMITFEIATGKVVKSCFTEEEFSEITMRFEIQKGSKTELEEDFVINVVTQLDRFRNCDFRGVKFMDNEYKDILRKMGAIVE